MYRPVDVYHVSDKGDAMRNVDYRPCGYCPYLNALTESEPFDLNIRRCGCSWIMIKLLTVLCLEKFKLCVLFYIARLQRCPYRSESKLSLALQAFGLEIIDTY